MWIGPYVSKGSLLSSFDLYTRLFGFKSPVVRFCFAQFLMCLLKQGMVKLKMSHRKVLEYLLRRAQKSKESESMI